MGKPSKGKKQASEGGEQASEGGNQGEKQASDGGEQASKLSTTAMVRISKQLTQILRHSGRSEGLEVRSDGYAGLEEVMRLKSMAKLKPTDEAIREIVKTSDKQRFGLIEDDQGRTLIRANQGHSMEGIDMDELCGSPVLDLEEGEVCCHGTYESHLESILSRGLLAGGKQGQSFRKTVHFSVRPPGETVISGMRQNCQIAIYVDLARAARDGIRFYRSANHVILTEGDGGVLPAKYIGSIWHIQRQEQIYPTPAGRVSLHLEGDALQSPAGELRCSLMAYRVIHRPLVM